MGWLNRLSNLFRRNKVDKEIDEELQFHLEARTRLNLDAGMKADAAAHNARRRFGNATLAKERAHELNIILPLETIGRDLRYGVRTLSRTPGFTLIAVVVMALGIGANLAFFTVVRSVLLKPLPYRDPGRLVMLYETETERSSPNPFMPAAAGNFREWQQAARGKADLALVAPFHDYSVSAEGGKLPEKIEAAWCSGNLFSVAGYKSRPRTRY